MSPQYLSILATMVEPEAAARPPRGTALARERIWLGHIWFAIAARFPLNYIDGLISSRLYKLDRQAEDRLAVLETAVNKAENE